VVQKCHMPLPAVPCIATQEMPSNSAWKLVGKRPNGVEVDFGDHIGRVATVLASGCAFVDCPEIRTEHGRDAYIHSNVMEQCGLTLGDKISFVVHINSSGAPQVSAPLWIHVGESNLHKSNGMHELDAGGDDGWTNRRTDNNQGNWRYKSPSKESSLWWDDKQGKNVLSSGSIIEQDKRGLSRVEDEDLCIGEVAMVNLEGLFAMVSCEDLACDKDVYVHRTTADLDSLQVDDTVAFKLHVNRRGSPQASPPFWKLSSRHSGAKHTQIGKYRGTVCKITDSGNAFVECLEPAGEIDRDVFVHESLVRECCLVVGDEVAFCVHYGRTGQPQLSAPCWKLSIPGQSDTTHLPHDRQDRQGGSWHSQRSGTASRKSSWDSRSVAESQLALPEPTTSLQVVDHENVLPPWDEEDALDVEWKPDGLYVGRVSETNTQRGRSMVRSPDWGDHQDVYVHKSVAEPGAISIGDIVAFQIHLNARGQPQASAPFWKQVGWRPKGKAVRFGKYQGLVARLLVHGSSFLDCTEVSECFGRDAYVHHAVMKQCDLVEGNLIAFDIHVSSSGNPQVSAPCWICCSDDKLMRDRLPEIPIEPRRGRSNEPSRGHSREENCRRRSRYRSRSCRKDNSGVRGHGGTTSDEEERQASLRHSGRRRDATEELPPLKRMRRDQESNDKKIRLVDCYGIKPPSCDAAPQSPQSLEKV